MIIVLPPQNNKSKDWPFMEASIKTLENTPDTWKQYPNTEAGAMAIVKMEFNELTAAASSVPATKQELVHLASACLHMWRKLSNDE